MNWKNIRFVIQVQFWVIAEAKPAILGSAVSKDE